MIGWKKLKTEVLIILMKKFLRTDQYNASVMILCYFYRDTQLSKLIIKLLSERMNIMKKNEVTKESNSIILPLN